MPRNARISPVGIPQHVITLGNNRQVCFTCEDDMDFYLSCLKEYSAENKMNLAEPTCEILKVCQPLIKENREAIGQTFYQLLFDKYPSLQGMFNMSHFRKDDDKPGAQVPVI